MKNILIFASLAGIASAIAIYFVTESKNKSKSYYVSDNDIEAYDYIENTGRPTIV